MVEIGYKLCSEEHRPDALVQQAQRAEAAGFRFAAISDHYHPWTDRQGQSPFVWAVIGGIAQATARLRIGTAVTCPTMRIHPAIIAQAAATAAAMLPGRFFLGVGTGENLNEHILGSHWPAHQVRAEMLAEAVQIIRLLWQGGVRSHRGRYFTVENARLYTLPDQPPPVIVAASGPKAAQLAARIGDGLIATGPQQELVDAFAAAGGRGRPRYGELTVCWAADEATARRTVHEHWPIAGLQGALTAELPLPQHFEQASQTVREEDATADATLGPDPEQYVEKLRAYAEAGFDHVALHQVGADQEGFIRFYERELAPRLRQVGLMPAGGGTASAQPA